RAEQLVDGDQGGRHLAVTERLGAQQAHHDGEQEAPEVDDPVPQGPPGAAPGAVRVGVELVQEGGREEPSGPREHRGGLRRLVTSHGRQIYAGGRAARRVPGGIGYRSRGGADFRRTGRLGPWSSVAPGPSPGRSGRGRGRARVDGIDRKSTRLNSSHVKISYAVFCLKKKI